MKTVFALFILLLVTLSSYAQQDTLVKRNNERIVCKVKEIGTDEIKYLLAGSDIVMVIDKNDVSRVVTSAGTVIAFDESMKDEKPFLDQHKNLFKVGVFSPLAGYTALAYERSLKPGSSMELGVGIIGAGQKFGTYKSEGVSVRLGYKFIKSPDFYLKGMRYAHLLKGGYFRPEIVTSMYHRHYKDIFACAILLNIGNQWVFNDFIALDLYVGAGYGYSTEDEYDIQFGYSTGARDFPLALTSGFRLGILF